jgi:anthranilate synthase
MDDYYVTGTGIKVLRRIEELAYESALNIPLADIDQFKGAVFASGYEYPGRYSRWDIAFLNPPLQIICYGRDFVIDALNARGKILADFLFRPLSQNPHVAKMERSESGIKGAIVPTTGFFPEEQTTQFLFHYPDPY